MGGAGTISPSSIKLEHLAIYPIYVPVWLIEYQVEEEGFGTRQITVAAFNYFRFGLHIPGVYAIYDPLGDNTDWFELGPKASKPVATPVEVGVLSSPGVTFVPSLEQIAKSCQALEKNRAQVQSITKDASFDLSTAPASFMRFSCTASQNREYSQILWDLKQAQDTLAMYERLDAQYGLAKTLQIEIGFKPLDTELMIQTMKTCIEGLLEKQARLKPAWIW